VATAQDIARREAIADYRVVGEPPQPDLDGLVRLAATLCGVSTAVINIIDDRMQHQVAAVGFEPATCSREDSMCAVVLQHPGHVMVSDARADERFARNPFVTGEIARVRFYASSPLVTPDGIAIGTLCVFDESPGELRAEHSAALDVLAHQVVDVLELRRLTHELARSNEQLASFAAQVSHDLHNPLMALSGFLELASDSPEMAHAPHAAAALGRAESAAERMTALVSDLLDFARVGGAQPRRGAVEMQRICREALDDLSALVRSTDAVVHIDAPIRPTGDPTLLRALIQNLVANALKFTAASGAAPRIDVRGEVLAGGWRLTVDDNGPGVPVERRDRMFELMERGASSAVEGLGIGLATCRRIVQSHGGRIGIADSPAGGTRVWVTLPGDAERTLSLSKGGPGTHPEPVEGRSPERALSLSKGGWNAP
jgi:signal transduction histidine kinase